ncbi:uncharacterized protein P884DRAFT_253166 [Thermothelomyces heterothallicus CBS 202.75]|uniref:uncharacterized protein n=1 Tax=Thermothelomyces heterothallicus CBS 202.75 TaxID=1149848 RepID=UPI003743784F
MVCLSTASLLATVTLPCLSVLVAFPLVHFSFLFIGIPEDVWHSARQLDPHRYYVRAGFCRQILVPFLPFP